MSSEPITLFSLKSEKKIKIKNEFKNVFQTKYSKQLWQYLRISFYFI